MDKNEIKLEVLKAALNGSLALDTSQLDNYCDWVQRPDNLQQHQHVIAQPIVARRQPQPGFDDSIEDTLVRTGEFVTRMQSLVTPRVVTKCVVAFEHLNVVTIRDLRATSKRSVLNIKNTGRQTVEAIEKTLATYGVAW